MCSVAKILLSQLKFHHDWSMLHSTKQWVKRFPWLKVQRTILHLNDDILFKFSIKWFKLRIGLFYPVRRNFIVVDKCPPHNDAVVRCKRFREHVRSVGVGALVILRTWLSFGIRLNSEATEVRDVLI